MKLPDDHIITITMTDNIKKSDLRGEYKILLKNLRDSLNGNTQPLKIKKKTISNLFRYGGRTDINAREMDLNEFDKPLFLDKKNKTLEVGGFTTWENIVDYTLPQKLLPLITPELKHITVGGAIVGIGIESNSHRYGFVHNSLLEADVLLSNGKVLTCSAKKNKDLFDALANSYGTLGYVLRAKIKLRSTLPYMRLLIRKHKTVDSFLSDLENQAKDRKMDHIEGLIYSKKELYLATASQTKTPENLKSIYGSNIFYKEISRDNEFTLKTKDYIFRYDPEWFWNMPDTVFIKLFRKISPLGFRNSGFYTRFAKTIEHIPLLSTVNPETEELIQDWEVPMRHAGSLIKFVLDAVDLLGKPLMVALIKLPKTPTLYPMRQNQLYFNLGSYSFVKKVPGKPYQATKIIDEFCIKHNGIKMLYSSTFLKKSEFDKIYNGAEYKKLKAKYDPASLLPTLFEKAVKVS